MKKNILVLSIILVSLLLAVKPPAVNAQPGSSEYSDVDAYMEETLKQFHIKGMALAFVKGDQILYMQGYGTANQQGDAATPQTPWPVGSITKSFTAMAVHQLMQAGKIDVNAPLQKYIPEFKLADPEVSSAITISHLLNHTSGISTVEGTQVYINTPDMTFEEALKHLVSYEPSNPPGEVFEYSNWNYILLAKVIEKVSGEEYTDYMRENIFDPLEMTRSTFDDFHDIPGAASGNMIAFGFSVPYNESYQPVILGAGNMTSTAEDMAHYLTTFSGKGSYNGKSILTSPTRGWYDPWWNWNSGYPSSDVFYGFSGGLNSYSATCLLAPDGEYGLILMLNTRLDEINPSKDSYAIAVDVINIAVNHTSRTVSSKLYYAIWAAVDLVFLALTFSVLWQSFRIKKWKASLQKTNLKAKVLGWMGIVLDVLLAAGIFYLPTVMKTAWVSALSYRPDFALPLLLIGLGLTVMGILKIALMVLIRKKQ